MKTGSAGTSRSAGTRGRSLRPRPREQPAEEPSALRAALSVAGTLVPPLTVLTSLMLYFGWARSDTQARAMGLDVSLFGYTTQDYVMRSVSTLFIPLLVTAGVTLAFLTAHRYVLRLVRNDSRRPAMRTAGLIGMAVGLAAIGSALVVASVRRDAAPLVIPLVLAVATLLTAYGGWLARAADDRERGETPAWQQTLRKLLVGSVISLALFWELSNYAGVVGRGYAVDIARHLTDLPAATAYSTEPLGIEGPGVCERSVVESGGAKRYRTTGLRLLAQSGNRFFLLHDGWNPGSGTVVVVPDDGKIRWQFSRARAVSRPTPGCSNLKSADQPTAR